MKKILITYIKIRYIKQVSTVVPDIVSNALKYMLQVEVYALSVISVISDFGIPHFPIA